MKKFKYTMISVPLLVILAAGGLWVNFRDADIDQGSASDGKNQAQTVYELEDVALHSTPTDCWLVIESKVYDVTKFVASKRHPGGAAILQGCGKDATELFNTRPMGSKTPHSDTARGFLPQFYIGDLKVVN